MKFLWSDLLNFSKRKAFTPVAGVVAAVGLLSLTGCGGSGIGGGSNSLTPNAVPQDSTAQTTVAAPDQATTSGVLQPHNITSDRRMAVVYEAFYAMQQTWLNPPNTTGPLNGIPVALGTASNWNYIGSDWNAVNYVAAPNRLTMGNATVCSFFGPSDNYGTYQLYGRGGECLFFVDLILWRSHLITDNARPTYTNWNQIMGNGPASSGQPGDLVFYKNKGGIKDNNHIGIYVYKRDSTHFDVIDSNFVGTARNNPNAVSPQNPDSTFRSYTEMIGRHTVSNSDGWLLFSGNGRWYGPGGH